MKNQKSKLVILFSLIVFASCDRVAPNYYGVLMENYGKSKSDYSKVLGKVSTWSAGTELFQVPAFEQRANFGEQTLHLKAADNTEFNAKPLYSYKVIESRCVDVVFQNARLSSSGKEFMRALEDDILEPHIYDLIKEESRKYSTDTLMANGGSLRFETKVQDLVKKSFEEKGLELITFSANLDFSDKVKAKIDSRNEVNTNVSVIDQQIIEQKKRNELAELKAQENIILSKGITKQLLQQQFIEKWDGHTPLYGDTPITLMKSEK